MPQAPSSLPEDQLKAHVEHKFREGLWVNHGCPIAALYRDDGQMQCPICRLNFKTMPLLDLCVILIGLGRLHAGIVPQWQPIETAPKDGTSVLVYDKSWCCGGPKISTSRWIAYKQRDGSLVWSVKGGFSGVTQATHWMPLPKGPEMAKASR